MSKSVEIVAYSGKQLSISSLDKPVVIDLSGMQMTDNVQILSEHDATMLGLAGSGVAKIVNNQVVVSGSLVDTPQGQTIIALDKQGVEWQASVGCDITEKKVIEAGKTIIVNGHKETAPPGGMYVATKSLLREVSIVVLGADANTVVDIAAAKTEAEVTTDRPAEVIDNTIELQALRTNVDNLTAQLKQSNDRAEEFKVQLEAERQVVPQNELEIKLLLAQVETEKLVKAQKIDPKSKSQLDTLLKDILAQRRNYSVVDKVMAILANNTPVLYGQKTKSQSVSVAQTKTSEDPVGDVYAKQYGQK